MSAWTDRLLSGFIADLARRWIAVDPDGLLLDEGLLAALRARGFHLLSYDDPLLFRLEYEAQYRAPWSRGEQGPAQALILHFKGPDPAHLPWDWRSEARQVDLDLAGVFPCLAVGVVRQVDPARWGELFRLHEEERTGTLGESATLDFTLRHLHRLTLDSVQSPEDLWREVLRLHQREAALPPSLAAQVARRLQDRPGLGGLPIEALLSSGPFLLQTLQAGWARWLRGSGFLDTATAEPATSDQGLALDIPWAHPEVRGVVQTLFLAGQLTPVRLAGDPASLPDWARVGVVAEDRAWQAHLEQGIERLGQELPGPGASFRDWLKTARRLGELLARHHGLAAEPAQAVAPALSALQARADQALEGWLRAHYADLASLPAVKAPVMVHHIPRYLARQLQDRRARIVLIVLDGLALDQWVLVREGLQRWDPGLGLDEGAAFAWAPTLTSVSRQALFSGLRPREFADSIEVSSAEASSWARFWQDQGLRPQEVTYQRGLRRDDQLEELAHVLGGARVRVVGLVVDVVDKMVHGAVLGKRGVASLIERWMDTGFVQRLLELCLSGGFEVYLTSDHGNVEAVGQGRPRQGVAAEVRGERVRVYRQEVLAAGAEAEVPGACRLSMPGLPERYHPVFAGGRTAFLPEGDQGVVHGGLSLEELVVPFVRVQAGVRRG